MKTAERILLKDIRLWIVVFIVALVLSGITAFPIEAELRFLLSHIRFFPESMQEWIFKINKAVSDTKLQFSKFS